MLSYQKSALKYGTSVGRTICWRYPPYTRHIVRPMRADFTQKIWPEVWYSTILELSRILEFHMKKKELPLPVMTQSLPLNMTIEIVVFQ